VEVAVHQCVGQGAVGQHLPPPLQAFRGAQFLGAQLGADWAVEQGADGGGQDFRAAVRDAGRRLLDAGLCGGQATYGVRHHLRGRVPAVHAGYVGQEQATRRTGQDCRHQVRVDRGDRGDRGRLGGGEGGYSLEPDRAVGGWQAKQPGQVPGLALGGSPGEVDVVGCPLEEFSDSRRSCPGQPEGVIIVDEVAGGQVPR
jgi:hypothetical protein